VIRVSNLKKASTLIEMQENTPMAATSSSQQRGEARKWTGTSQSPFSFAGIKWGFTELKHASIKKQRQTLLAMESCRKTKHAVWIT
jgi:hypothetical protein